MKSAVFALAILIMVAANSRSIRADDRLEEKKQKWQAVLERREFFPPKPEGNLMSSLRQYNGKYPIHLIIDPAKRNLRTIEVHKEGKPIVSLQGNDESAFQTADNVLYFATIPSRSGYQLSAHDLESGKQLWQEKREGLEGNIGIYFGNYDSAIAIFLGQPSSGRNEDGTVVIVGREDNGDYIEVLDRTNGQLLARKVYRDSSKK